MQRDRERLQNFNNRVKTRSQEASTENIRHGDTSTATMSNFSPGTGVGTDWSPSTDILSSNFESPLAAFAQRSDVIPMSSTPSESTESLPSVDMPSVPDVLDSFSALACADRKSAEPAADAKVDPNSKPKLVLRKGADGVKSELLYEHISNHSHIEYDDIKCDNCPLFMRSIGIEVGMRRLLYCYRCDKYLCSTCRPPDTTENMTHSTTCNSPIFFIT